MFLHLAGASVSQYSITVGQRQATGRPGAAMLRVPAPTSVALVGNQPQPLSGEGPGLWGRWGGRPQRQEDKTTT